MVVDNDSKLVIGWLVDNKKVRDLIAENKKKTPAPIEDDDHCTREECLCRDCIESLNNIIPEGWELVVVSPYYNSQWDVRTVAVSAKFDCGDSCEYLHHGMSISADVVLSVLSNNNTESLKAGFSFAVTLTTDENQAPSPRVMSLPHIW